MREETIQSFDGRTISVFYGDFQPQRQYVAIVLPFGLRPAAAVAACARLSPSFNVLTWQSRSIVDCSADDREEVRLTPQMHAEDLVQMLRHFGIGSSHVVGFCSGAGIALLAASRYRQLFGRLVLVCGEYMLPADVCPRTNFQREVDNLLPLAATSRRLAATLCEKLTAGKSKAESEFDEHVSLPFSNPEYLYRHGLNYLTYRAVDFRQVARSVPHKALLISTGDDRQVTARSSEIIADLLVSREGHLTFPGDHYEFLRGRAEMVEAIAAFLREQG